MALHGNKPIRLTYSNNRVHYPAVTTNGRNAIGGSRAETSSDIAERRRRLRLARIRRLRQQRLLRLRSTTTTTEATTTTSPPTTTTVPAPTESTTSWYDSWLLEETQTSAPSGFTDSLDYSYEYKIDDY